MKKEKGLSLFANNPADKEIIIYLQLCLEFRLTAGHKNYVILFTRAQNETYRVTQSLPLIFGKCPLTSYTFIITSFWHNSTGINLNWLVSEQKLNQLL